MTAGHFATEITVPLQGEHAFYNYSEVNHEQEKDS